MRYQHGFSFSLDAAAALLPLLRKKQQGRIIQKIAYTQHVPRPLPLVDVNPLALLSRAASHPLSGFTDGSLELFGDQHAPSPWLPLLSPPPSLTSPLGPLSRRCSAPYRPHPSYPDLLGPLFFSCVCSVAARPCSIFEVADLPSSCRPW